MTRDHASSLPRPALAAVLAVATAAFLLLVPLARGHAGAVVWTSPASLDQLRYTVGTGGNVHFVLKASTSVKAASVSITPLSHLPLGAVFNSSTGKVAQATFRWAPPYPGDFTLRFAAVTNHGAAAPRLTYQIHVDAAARTMTNAKIGHWAPVLAPVVARTGPSLSARPVTTLETTTTDRTQNIVLILAAIDLGPNETWYRVRLPILPNNSTGWVPSSALGQVYTVHTHVYVDREKMTLTLKRDGKTVFTTRVGVGKPFWPTPRGEFYVRDKMTGFTDPIYGPLAFGTSARSAVLTDWPGGGFVGIHGTNEPGILPGHVSHGCIRLHNEAILQLARLLQIGSPLTIT